MHIHEALPEVRLTRPRVARLLSASSDSVQLTFIETKVALKRVEKPDKPLEASRLIAVRGIQREAKGVTVDGDCRGALQAQTKGRFEGRLHRR